MCLNPKKIVLNGTYQEDNYKAKKGEQYHYETFTKCGFCEQCIAEKANNWVIRNTYESKEHKEICFITLTYANNPFFLVKKDLQDFIKRLRRYLDYHENGKKVRCFSVGEYGTVHHRPHFHIIIYGWIDKNAKFIRLSKKNNFVFESDIIKKLWGKGITSYQEFNSKEIPYISLYNTSKDNISSEYKISRKNADKLLKNLKEEIGLKGLIKNYKFEDKKDRITDKKREEKAELYKRLKEDYKNLQKTINFKTKVKYKRYRAKITYDEFASKINQIEQLENEIIKLKKSKEKYITVKEFNTWSIAIGWKKFFENYQKYYNYDFNEFIEDKEFITPTPWVKKLANNGFEDARIEMLRRSAELAAEETTESLKAKNQARRNSNNTQKIIEWADITKHPEL